MIEMAVVLPAVTAFCAAAMTLMTGFGLATVLTPVLLIFYDVKVAILIAAVVHLLNNLLKLSLFLRHIDSGVLKRFGFFTLAGAFIGAYLQGMMDSSWVKVLLGCMLVFLGMKEVFHFGDAIHLPKRFDVAGGFLSGLMGGFVGNQGAIRSAYLLNYSMSKEAFVATAAVIASVVDVTRIPLYVANNRHILSGSAELLVVVTVAAFAGTLAGKRIMKHFSLKVFRSLIAAFIIVIGMLLIFRIV